MKTLKLLLIALLLPWVAIWAQPADSTKVINRSTMVGLGWSNVLDTYLSQEHFKGFGASFLNTIERKRLGNQWSTLIEHEANISSLKDRARSKHELEAAYNFYWGKLYNWQLLDNQLTLQAGGLVNASLGVIYNTSNSNNPAQARIHLNVMPTGVAAYRFQLFNRPMTARYEPPLGGHHVLAQLRTVVLRDIRTWRLRPQHHSHDVCLCSRVATHANRRRCHQPTVHPAYRLSG